MATSPLSIEERRRRRDQQSAVQAATQIVQTAAAERRTVTLEWAAAAALLAVGLAIVLGTWYRHLEPSRVGGAAWLGLVLGAVVAGIIVAHGRGRFTNLALGIFVGAPLAAIPLRLFGPVGSDMTLFVIAAGGGALAGGALRGIVALRVTAGTMRQNMAAMGQASGRAARAVGDWLHDAVIKALASLILAAIGAGLVYFGRLQNSELYVWIGFVLVFLVGSVGLWSPGLYKRTPFWRALRHCGQLCLWLSLLVVPLFELAPAGSLPYVAHPSIRFVAMGLGLVLIGTTWFLQRLPLLAHGPRPTPKGTGERLLALIVVLVGLVLTVGAANAYQRAKVSVDQSAISVANVVGNLAFEPTDQVKSLLIVQPVERVPFYVEYVQFQDGKSFQLFPFFYPGDQLQADNHGLVKAIRLAGGLNQQSMPESRVEQWSR